MKKTIRRRTEITIEIHEVRTIRADEASPFDPARDQPAAVEAAVELCRVDSEMIGRPGETADAELRMLPLAELTPEH